ncbi:MAG: hypothetical protein ATN33_02815 [Epulopiscium sp. Nele67-Bin001]|nr:MAG: hypothetical protein BEN18_09770 [Epulopiscium sp. Nuni2H_MBin001]OON90509.1 MAG: hypothetical protein ATN33_02815 [Epulopiscium sp. Nele67-Bin001]
MTKRILILTMSSKQRKYCVAGLDVDNNQFIRLVDNRYPESNGITTTQMMDPSGKFAKILDLVSVTKLTPAPTPIQPENYTISSATTFKIEVKLSPNFLSTLIQRCPVVNSNSILGNKSFKIAAKEANKLNHSIELLYVQQLVSYINEAGRIKADFRYNEIMYRNFTVTDPDIFFEPVDADAAYIVVSLGELNNKRKIGEHYKFVAKIFVVDGASV